MTMFRSISTAVAVAVVALANTAAHADGDAAKGEKVFKRCKACHTLEQGKHRVGPSLAGLFDRKAGSAEGYKYSENLAKADFTWDEEKLMTYLESPKDMFAGSTMVFRVTKKDDRADVVAYLKQETK